MDERPGLRAVDDGEYVELTEGPAEPAAATAMRFLLHAQQATDRGEWMEAHALAAIGQGWATLALTEPAAAAQGD